MSSEDEILVEYELANIKELRLVRHILHRKIEDALSGLIYLSENKLNQVLTQLEEAELKYKQAVQKFQDLFDDFDSPEPEPEPEHQEETRS